MARLEAQAVAGYFPTPKRVLPLIARLFDPGKSDWDLCDPCAGDGEAAFFLAQAYRNNDGRDGTVYACELESGRHAAMVERCSGWNDKQKLLMGDAFRVEFKHGLVGLLYHNPPYDTDPDYGRLEHRWLSRFWHAVMPGGYLAHVVPYYALAVSADLIARHFDDVECFAFPEPEFEQYSQVVLVARRSDTRLEPDPTIFARFEEWSKGERLAPLRSSREAREIPRHAYVYGAAWAMRHFDASGLLAKSRPWRRTSRGGRLEPFGGALPELPIAEHANRKFPVATPPRPAHLAAGLAAGMFNGKRVSAARPNLPDLLVKGTFDREYVTVEEKQNADGDVTSVLEVQQPRLTITVLDLSSGRYHALGMAAPEGKAPGSFDTIEDLLEAYGPDLARVMREQCPVVYDPADPDPTLTLAPLDRPLYKAQEDVGRAVLGMLRGGPKGSRLGPAAILQGEVGTGKTSISIAVAKTDYRRPLVMCPPHLLQNWRDEVLKVMPEARVRVLASVADVDDAARDASPGVVFSILSREVAKLGHSYEGVSGQCPRCGGPVHEAPEELARRRMVCGHELWRRPANEEARLATELALALAPFDPDSAGYFFKGRHGRRLLASYREKTPAEGSASAWGGMSLGLVDRILECVSNKEALGEADADLIALVLLESDDSVRARTVGKLAGNPYHRVADAMKFAVAAMEPGERRDAAEKVAFAGASSYYYGTSDPGQIVKAASEKDGYFYSSFGKVTLWEGSWFIDGVGARSLELAAKVLKKLSALARFEHGTDCGEPLYQASPSPRRYPLATYIARRHRRAFDFVIIDEAHEEKDFDASAQGIAAARLSGMGAPTLRLTGSIMNGYASSLFGTMWLTSPGFRAEYGRDEMQRYLDRYGYRKRIVSDRDKETRDPVAFGTSSDRVVRSARIVGNAPGILPLFLFRHLLRHSATLHKADLSVDIPPCTHHVHVVDAGKHLGAEFRRVFAKLVEQIKADRYDETGKAGKLFGALADIGGYLDVSSELVGNREDGRYSVAYPESCGGEVLTVARSTKDGWRSPKERWLTELVAREVEEGRNLLVFTWHVRLMPRIQSIVKADLGLDAVLLEASKVPTGKRQDWIDRNVVAKGARVMVANPTTVQTGLNNLVHFNTEVFYENPACNPTVERQAVGRIDRIGAKKPTRVHFPVYGKTVQEQMHALMLRKVAIATAADGLDAESVLIAAGGSDDAYMAGLSLGKQLFTMLEQAERRGLERRVLDLHEARIAP